MAQSLAPIVNGCVFRKAELLRDSSLHPASLPLERLTGQRIAGLARRGKLLVFSLEGPPAVASPLSLVVHLRMTGRLFTNAANTALGKHTRCVFTLEKPDSSSFQLFFDDARTFGKILLASPEILSSWLFWASMGPEPFNLTATQLKSALNSRRPIKTALLDQSVIAGIGNIYADETLFASRLHPLRPANDLDLEELESLLANIKVILRDAIAKKGSSIRDYRDAEGRQGAFQKYFSVYSRAGLPCKSCGTILEKLRIGGRASVFCPHCQKLK